MRVAAVILAAGESSRLGRPKQDLVLNGETLLQRAVRIAKDAGLSPVIAVVRDGRYIDSLQQEGALPLLNRKADEGMASSIRVGITAAQGGGASGAVLMTCDQPGVTAVHLHSLLAEPENITGSAYAQRVGVPAYFPASAFPALLELQGDTGARAFLRDARAVHLQVLSVDVDTEEDFQTAQKLFGR